VVDLSKIPAIDIVIGLAFVYFLLSLVISSLTEALASMFQLRWKTLHRGLRELFENSGADAEAAAKGSELWERFQNNPRIKALWKETSSLPLPKRGPSYIPPRVLALTLLDTLAPPPEPAPQAEGATRPKEEEVNEAVEQLKKDHDVVDQAKRAAATVPNPALRKWLVDALTKAGDEREEILKELEESFNELTNRVSGWYKRHATIWVAVFAVVLTGALNVDSYAIGSRLWKDEAVRSAVAGQAGKLTDPTICPAKDSNAEKSKLEQATDCVADLESLGLPIGWADENRPDTVEGWIAKIPGWVVTVFALLLGAPFWFDTLSKLARLRITGKPEGTARGDTGKPKN